MVMNPPANAGDVRDKGLIPVSGRSPGRGNGNSLQYPCLENPMHRGAWQATVNRAANSQTRLSVCARAHTHTHTQVLGTLDVLRSRDAENKILSLPPRSFQSNGKDKT